MNVSLKFFRCPTARRLFTERIAVVSAIAITLFVAVFSGCTRQEAPPVAITLDNRPNVLVIVIDTLRRDHLGTYGYERNTSPFIDKLASEGIVFDRAYSGSSFTCESVSQLLSGQFSSLSGATGWNARPPESEETLITLFANGKYRTGFFSATAMLRFPPFFRGADVVSNLVDTAHTSGNGDKLADGVIDFASEDDGRPWFAYAHFFDPHAPYVPPKEYLDLFNTNPHPHPIDTPLIPFKAKFQEYLDEGFGPGDWLFEDMVSRYDGEIRWTDDSVKRLVEGLNASGELDNTVIILTADHGEEFLDHGYVEHAYTLYDEAIHIPMVLWAPDRLAPARVNDTVSHIDIIPTLAAFAGITAPAYCEGASLVEAADEGRWGYVSPPDRTLIHELLVQTRGVMRAVRHGDWKWIAAQEWLSPEARSAITETQYDAMQEVDEGARPKIAVWGPLVRSELYNVAEDPKELHDRSSDAVDILADMTARYEAYRARVAPEGDGGTGDDLTQDEIEALRSGGYL